jgi:hypothetical protein
MNCGMRETMSTESKERIKVSEDLEKRRAEESLTHLNNDSYSRQRQQLWYARERETMSTKAKE